MLKKPKTIIKLQILSGMANASPPIGPTLGQHGINIIGFCKAFNQECSPTYVGLHLPVIITIYTDKSFTFIIKSPITTGLLKKFALIKKGSNKPGSITVGIIKKKNIKEIAKLKQLDMTGKNLESIIKTIIGTAKSMGLVIED